MAAFSAGSQLIVVVVAVVVVVVIIVVVPRNTRAGFPGKRVSLAHAKKNI